MFNLEAPTLAVAESDDRFPVRRIYCVGRNYAEHAREFGNDPDRDPPFFFTKPADAAFTVEEGYRGGAPESAPYPPGTEDLQHEIELVVALGRGGSDVPVDEALDLVWGYAVGVDLTLRDVQNVAKQMRRPWDLSKGFDASAPLSVLSPVSALGNPSSGTVTASVNGELRQSGDLADQIWSVPEVIAILSRAVRLEAGDLIMTGTPAGVGTLRPGDEFVGEIAGVGRIQFRVG